MKLRKLILTKNACYKAGRTIAVKGIMVHSTGANNPNLKRYVGPDDGLLGHNPNNNHWNQDRPDRQQKCVHAFIGKLADGSIATYQTLPWNHRGWHAGGAANDTHIGFEICEDGLTDRSYFDKVYLEAVELCAHLCKEFRLTEKNIICHSEGARLGIASNHGDVMHWFPKHGKSMDTFREEVRKRLAAGAGGTVPAAQASGSALYYVQTGAFSNKTNADAQLAKVKAAGFEAIMKRAGNLYRVQVGAYSQKANADTMAAKLKAAGFDTYVTTTGGTQVVAGTAPTPAQGIRTGSKVKVKPGAKTYTGGKLAGFVYSTVYDVQQISGNRAIIGLKGQVTAAMKLQDLILQ